MNMSEIKLNIDGREVTGFEGQTILSIARANGIDIPTLCHDDRVEMYGSCGICAVEAEGTPKLLRSCSTYASNGMIIRTNTERVRQSRKTALELLLSDHTGDCRPPCVLACPAQTDCQGYVGLIANGEYGEALKLIKDKIPLPASIGRVCPHPCEEACRRTLVEEPIAIAALKQFAGDLDLERDKQYTAQAGNPTGKNVAVVGGGPGGLTAAYFLRIQGHGVTVYDAMPHMGGMLQYGIPEYRLPKKLLAQEIDPIEKMGVEYRNDIKIGRDLTLDYLRNTYDAVVVAIGAWSSVGLRCPGEELDGVVGGIDFLRHIQLNNPVFTGRRIAVVGGGNTAMDACRTAVRLGADKVYNIYRRTMNEMPAEEIEITEAEEEGVIFKNLTNPIEVVGESGKVKAVRLQMMALGEADASGRRAPVAIPGKEETIEVDTVIVAIGQKLDSEGFEEIEQTKWRTISADEHTFRTNLDGVFAVGDATNNGADIAITAIGEAKKAAEMVNKYLNGEELTYEVPYLVKTEKTSEDFAGREEEPRARMPHRCAGERRNDFLEVNLGFTEEEAKREASRCLECGCHDYFECKLIDYANQYTVQPEKYAGKIHRRAQEDNHPFIHRNPDKCILCGLCVRICDEVVGATALGLLDRGFDTIVKPALDTPLSDTDCISCGQCVAVCPTGALTETMMIGKQVPLEESITKTVCSFCSVGCKSRLTSSGRLLIRSLPSSEKDALLCVKGRFGFGEIEKKKRLTVPMIRREGGMEETTFEQAIVYANKNLQSLKTQYGDNCVAVAVSDRYTNEEAYLIKEYAAKAIGTDKVFSFSQADSGLADVFGRDASTATLDEMENTDLVVVALPESVIQNHAVAGMKIRRAVNRGTKLLLLSAEESLLDSVATMMLDAGDGLSMIKQITKALLEGGRGEDIQGRGELEDSLKHISVSKEAKKATDMILQAHKAVFVFEKNAVTHGGARLIADIAVLSGHSGNPRDGVVQLLPGSNSQGLINLGIQSGEGCFRAIVDGEIRGLFIFGEEVKGIDLSILDFLAVQDLHMTDTAKQANVVFPASSFAEISGTFTSADGKVQEIKQAVINPMGKWDHFTQIKELSAQAGVQMPYRSIGDVRQAVSQLRISKRGAVRLAVAGGNTLRRRCGYPSTNGLCISLMDFAASKGLWDIGEKRQG